MFRVKAHTILWVDVYKSRLAHRSQEGAFGIKNVIPGWMKLIESRRFVPWRFRSDPPLYFRELDAGAAEYVDGGF